MYASRVILFGMPVSTGLPQADRTASKAASETDGRRGVSGRRGYVMSLPTRVNFPGRDKAGDGQARSNSASPRIACPRVGRSGFME